MKIKPFKDVMTVPTPIHRLMVEDDGAAGGGGGDEPPKVKPGGLGEDGLYHYTPKQLGEVMTQKIREHDSKRLEELKTERSARAKLEERLAELEKQGSNKADPGLEEKLQTLQSQHSGLAKQLEAERQAHAATRGQWQGERVSQHLQSLAARNGAGAKQLEAAARLFPQSQIRAETGEDGRPVVQIMDPLTGVAQDPDQAMASFLDANPFLKEQPAKGAGLSAGKPPAGGAKTNPLEGKSLAEQLTYAIESGELG